MPSTQEDRQHFDNAYNALETLGEKLSHRNLLQRCLCVFDLNRWQNQCVLGVQREVIDAQSLPSSGVLDAISGITNQLEKRQHLRYEFREVIDILWCAINLRLKTFPASGTDIRVKQLNEPKQFAKRMISSLQKLVTPRFNISNGWYHN